MSKDGFDELERFRHRDAFRRAERELYFYKVYRIALDAMNDEAHSIGSALNGQPCVQHSVTDGKVAALGARKAEYSRKCQVIERILETMGEDERRFVKLKYVQEIPYAIVASMMPCGEATVYRLRQRVLARMAVGLGLIWAEEEVAAAQEW